MAINVNAVVTPPTKAQVGLGNVPNLDTTDAVNHVSNTSNPHNVTKSQVGLSNVDNTSDANKPVSIAQQTSLNLKYDASNPSGFETPTQLNSRDTSNRNRANHTGTQLSSTISDFGIAASSAAPVQSVSGKTGIVTLTSSDVGLGNVDNTTDLNKPISTATQIALNSKVDSGSVITNVMKTVAFGNSIAVLSQYSQTSGMQKGVHIANFLTPSVMEFKPTTPTTWCDAYGIYGHGGATLTTMISEMEAQWFTPIGLANITPDLAIGYALIENDIVGGQTVAQMTASINTWISLVQNRWQGVRILLNTPHPSISYNTPTMRSNFASIRDYILSLDNGETIFCSDITTYSDATTPTDLSNPITYSVQGSRSGTTLTVTSLPVGVTLEINSYFFIGASTFYITAFGTGTGGTGTYTVSASGTNTAVTFTLCPFTDNSVHPNVKGTLRNARVNAATLMRISERWKRTQTNLSTNGGLMGSIAAQSPATGTVATGTVTSGLVSGTFVFTAENPGMLCTFTGNTGVTNFGTFNFGAVSITGVNTISPYLVLQIVSGAEYLKSIVLQARIQDSIGLAFRVFLQSETPDVWPEYQNGDVINMVYPPQGPVSGATAGSISALTNYVKFLTKYTSGTIVFRIISQGYYKIS